MIDPDDAAGGDDDDDDAAAAAAAGDGGTPDVSLVPSSITSYAAARGGARDGGRAASFADADHNGGVVGERDRAAAPHEPDDARPSGPPDDRPDDASPFDAPPRLLPIPSTESIFISEPRFSFPEVDSSDDRPPTFESDEPPNDVSRSIEPRADREPRVDASAALNTSTFVRFDEWRISDGCFSRSATASFTAATSAADGCFSRRAAACCC